MKIYENEWKYTKIPQTMTVHYDARHRDIVWHLDDDDDVASFYHIFWVRMHRSALWVIYIFGIIAHAYKSQVLSYHGYTEFFHTTI